MIRSTLGNSKAGPKGLLAFASSTLCLTVENCKLSVDITEEPGLSFLLYLYSSKFHPASLKAMAPLLSMSASGNPLPWCAKRQPEGPKTAGERLGWNSDSSGCAWHAGNLGFHPPASHTPGMAAHTSNPNTQEVETGGSDQGHPWEK